MMIPLSSQAQSHGPSMRAKATENFLNTIIIIKILLAYVI
jgi:hypothetical protein